MPKKVFFASFISLCALALAGCAPSQTTEPEVTDLRESISLDQPLEAEVEEMMLPAQEDELVYSGSAQFVTKADTWPCSEYTFDSEVCDENPAAEVSVDSHYVQVPTAEINAELLDYLQSNNALVEGGNYLIRVGCKSDGQIEGDMYGVFKGDLINSAFETGSTRTVEFVIDASQPARGSDASSCLSPITEFISVE